MRAAHAEQEYFCSLPAWDPAARGGFWEIPCIQTCRKAWRWERPGLGEMLITILTFQFAALTEICPFFFEPRSERCLYWKLGAADRVPQWNGVFT